MLPERPLGCRLPPKRPHARAKRQIAQSRRSPDRQHRLSPSAGSVLKSERHAHHAVPSAGFPAIWWLCPSHNPEQSDWWPASQMTGRAAHEFQPPAGPHASSTMPAHAPYLLRWQYRPIRQMSHLHGPAPQYLQIVRRFCACQASAHAKPRRQSGRPAHQQRSQQSHSRWSEGKYPDGQVPDP